MFNEVDLKCGHKTIPIFVKSNRKQIWIRYYNVRTNEQWRQNYLATKQTFAISLRLPALSAIEILQTHIQALTKIQIKRETLDWKRLYIVELQYWHVLVYEFYNVL